MNNTIDILIIAAALAFVVLAWVIDTRYTRRERRRSYIREVLSRKEGTRP